MLPILIVAIALQADPALVASPSYESRMAVLYRDVCLTAFPDDATIAETMRRRGAEPLSRRQLAIYLHDDPGSGWRLHSGTDDFIVTVENPPYHACSVRQGVATRMSDPAPYAAVTDAYRSSHPGFTPSEPMNIEARGNRSNLQAEQRATGENQTESLIVVTDSPINGSTPEVRYVHQFYAPTGRS